MNSAAEKQSPVPESSSSSSSKAALGCSAKKRWLMAAMSVDMTENDEGSGQSDFILIFIFFLAIDFFLQKFILNRPKQIKLIIH